MTFDKLNELLNSLSEGDWTNHKEASTARKHLKQIQKECDVARKEILGVCKTANPGIFKVKE